MRTNPVHYPRDGLLRLAIGLLPVLTTGCMRGSLATDTGWSADGPWCIERVQQAHVGETVRCSFVLLDTHGRRVSLWDAADYAVLLMGGERYETRPNIDDRFEFEIPLGEVASGQRVTLQAEAYLQQDKRDYMKIAGRWLRTESTSDIPDDKVADGHLRLEIYQCRICYRFAAPSQPLDWSLARLTLTRHDGSSSDIFVQKEDRPGFVVVGPDQAGELELQYEPTIEQINRTGTTSAVLAVHDLQGQLHRFAWDFPTP
ncbi:MAG: hypothetical protein HJJLKODD_01518 [Phycisphaerae bacterium]|nr:hypothetical protein [Phycisphaerae bacterium]